MIKIIIKLILIFAVSASFAYSKLDIHAEQNAIVDTAKDIIQLRRNAYIKQSGKLQLYSNDINIFYDNDNDHSTISGSIAKLLANDNIHISSDNIQIYGDRLIYNKKDGLLRILSKNTVKAVSPDMEILSSEFRYYENKGFGITKGGFLASSTSKEQPYQIAADESTFFLDNSAKNSKDMSISRIEIYDNVHLSYGDDNHIYGDHAVYNASKGSIFISSDDKTIVQDGSGARTELCGVVYYTDHDFVDLVQCKNEPIKYNFTVE